MKTDQTSILLFGHDESLLATRQWVLQSRGYRVLKIDSFSRIAVIPKAPPIQLILLCHTLSAAQSAAAVQLARARWPAIQTLFLAADRGRAPSGMLGQLLHTVDGPAKLISMVDGLVGNRSSLSSSARSKNFAEEDPSAKAAERT